MQHALERRHAELAVHLAVVLEFDPRLRRLVQEGERQLALALEHGHQAPLDAAPEGLLLAVLLGAVRERGGMDNAEALEPLFHLMGLHRLAIVGEQRARHAALLKSLLQPVHERLGALLAVPLQVARDA